MCEYDAGDLQIQGPDAQPLAAEVDEPVRSVGIPRKDDPLSEGFDLAAEFGVRADLAVRITVAADFGKPTAHLLFHCNDGHRFFQGGRFKSCRQALACDEIAFQFRKVV